jgi:hypothetical protein
MEIILSLAFEIALVVIAVGIVQFLVLVFRNTHRPQWLRSSFVESTAVIAIVMGITLSVAILATGLMGSGLNVFVALVVAMGVPLVVALTIWRIFRIGERLRRADAGGSPFAPLSDAPQGTDPTQPASA